MIYIIAILLLCLALLFILNFYFVLVVRKDEQEEYIKRGSRARNLYEVAAFGSSYCKYAFDFEGTGVKGYNFGIVAQFLYYTDLMIRSFRSSYKDNALIFIVLPDLVFAEGGKGLYGASRYVRFVNKKLLNDEYSIIQKIFLSYLPLFIPSLSNFKICIKKILTFKRSDDYNKLRHNTLSIPQNMLAAKQRCKDWCEEFKLNDTISQEIPPLLKEKFKQSQTILTGIIDYCIKENLRPVLIVTPVSGIMREHISKPFLEEVLYSNIIKANVQNIPVLDYLDDDRFIDIDLYANNADFLNARGREFFTKIVLEDVKKYYD